MIKKGFKILTCIVIFLSIILSGVNENVSASSVTKAEYTMKKDKVTIKDDDGKVRGIVYFQYPELKGTSSAITKINDTLKNDSKNFMQSDSAQNLIDSAKSAIATKVNGESVYTYFYKTICKVTYNDNSILGLHMKNCWYAGGVYNQEDYGYTYDLNTGAQLGLKDVVSGNSTSIKSKILAAGKKYLTVNNEVEQPAYDGIKSTKLKDFKFYLSKGKVYICFGSYELNRGTGWDIFSIKGKYK